MEEHQAVVAGLVEPRGDEVLDLAEAAGLVLSEDYHATARLPGFDNSAMDGYAVRAADIAGATAASPVVLPVSWDLPAGTADVRPLVPGTAHRIMTGAPVPVGADTVVQVEATDGGTQVVSIREERQPGTFVRTAGSDTEAGERVLVAGAVLGPAQLALLAALGESSARVIAPPRVLVVSTGSELVEIAGRLGPGQIHDANGVMLATAVELAGARAVRHLFVDDDVPGFLAALEGGLAGVDLVLTSGGVSAGAYEVVKDALSPRGVDFVKVAMQPGMPQGSGRFHNVPIVALPGNPVSSLVSFEVFVRPALRAAMGFTRTLRPIVTAAMSEPITSIPGKRQFRRGRLDRDSGRVAPCGPPASSFLRWLAQSDCLIDTPEDVTEVAAGESVAVWDLDA